MENTKFIHLKLTSTNFFVSSNFLFVVAFGKSEITIPKAYSNLQEFEQNQIVSKMIEDLNSFWHLKQE